MLIRTNFPARKRPSLSVRPDFIATSVAGIDFGFLRSKGIKACFIDLDGTVVSRGTHDVEASIQKALKDSGLSVYIATNRPKSRTLKSLKEDLSASGVIHPSGLFPKPSKHYYQTALRAHNFKAYEVIMIGDRYIQDIFGANRAGLYSMVVHKNGGSAGRFDTVLSKTEAHLTKRFTGRYREL